MGISELIGVLKLRKLIILWSAFAGFCAALLLALVLPPQYVSAAKVQVDSIQRNSLTGLAEPRFKVSEFLGQQAAIAGSRTVALQVINTLTSEGFIALSDFDERWRRETGGELIAGNDPKLWAADQLLKDLTITATDIGSTLDIAFKADDPAQAARVANAFAASYMSTILNQKQRQFARKAVSFSDETSALARGVVDAQNELANFRERSGILPMGAQKVEASEVELAALTQRVAEARADNAEAQSLLLQAETTPHAALVNFPLPGDALPALQAQGRLAGVVATIGRLRERYGENYPDFIEAMKERASLEASILEAVRDRATYAESRMRALETQAAKMKTEVAEMQKTRETYNMLEDRVATSQDTYNLVTTRSLQESLQSRVDTINVLLLARATPPGKPATPPGWVISLFGLFTGLAVGAAAAVFVELYEGRIRDLSAMRQIFRTAVLGEISAPMRRSRFKMKTSAAAS